MSVLMDEVLAQQIVDTVKSICGFDINFINTHGTVIASTNQKRVGSYHEVGHRVAKTGITTEVGADNIYTGTQKGINLPVYYNRKVLMVIGISGEPDAVRDYANLAHRIAVLLIREREYSTFSQTQTEKRLFIINSLIQQNYPDPDYMDALLDEFDVSSATEKRLILIRVGYQSVQTTMPRLSDAIEDTFASTKVALYCLNYPSDYFGVIDADRFDKQCRVFHSLAQTFGDSIKIAIGKPCKIYDLSKSHRSALVALSSIEKGMTNYALFDDLKLELITSSVKETARQEYLMKTINSLTDKDLILLRVYFEGNCTLQFCSEKLYIHKNTVQNQLNHIYDLCGLNPRRFEDAVLLYLALKLRNEMEWEHS